MIPLPPNIAAEDVHQWLGRGYFYVLCGGERMVASMYRVERDNVCLVRVLTDVKHENPIRCSFSALAAYWPRCGSLNLDNIAVHVQQIQRRQYTRTYQSNMLRITVPRKWDLMKHSGITTIPDRADDPRVVQAAFEPVYYTLDEALTQIYDGDALSRAITPTLIVVGDRQQNILLYYNGELIASLVDSRFVPINADDRLLRRLSKFLENRV